MQTPMSALDSAMAEVERLRRALKKNAGQAQVRSLDDRALVHATALAWFHTHRSIVNTLLTEQTLLDVDNEFKSILEASARHSARKNYLANLAALKSKLIGLRSQCVSAKPLQPTTDQPPDFSPLIADTEMQKVLVARWQECTRCLSVEASLAATVMMGGLLEALLLARINREQDKKPIFTAASTPKDKHGNARPLNEWVLKNYIEVVSELKWITVSAKDVGAVLRDYRNYIHPHKQLAHAVHLTPDDAALFWEISKSISRQIISVTAPTA